MAGRATRRPCAAGWGVGGRQEGGMPGCRGPNPRGSPRTPAPSSSQPAPHARCPPPPPRAPPLPAPRTTAPRSPSANNLGCRCIRTGRRPPRPGARRPCTPGVGSRLQLGLEERHALRLLLRRAQLSLQLQAPALLALQRRAPRGDLFGQRRRVLVHLVTRRARQTPPSRPFPRRAPLSYPSSP